MVWEYIYATNFDFCIISTRRKYFGLVENFFNGGLRPIMCHRLKPDRLLRACICDTVRQL